MPANRCLFGQNLTRNVFISRVCVEAIGFDVLLGRGVPVRLEIIVGLSLHNVSKGCTYFGKRVGPLYSIFAGNRDSGAGDDNSFDVRADRNTEREVCQS